MTNKDKYKRTFSVLHTSGQFKEVTSMKTTGRIRMSRLAAVCAAVILVMGLAGVAYAADIGGIQRSIQIWIHGDRTDAVLELRDGSYALSYEDAEGQTYHREGGGIAIDPWGNERPVTEEEILEYLGAPELEYRADGSVWLYCRDQEMEITDRFDENGICYVQLKDGENVIYMTIKYQGSYAYGPHCYPDPDSFS